MRVVGRGTLGRSREPRAALVAVRTRALHCVGEPQREVAQRQRVVDGADDEAVARPDQPGGGQRRRLRGGHLAQRPPVLVQRRQHQRLQPAPANVQTAPAESRADKASVCNLLSAFCIMPRQKARQVLFSTCW